MPEFPSLFAPGAVRVKVEERELATGLASDLATALVSIPAGYRVSGTCQGKLAVYDANGDLYGNYEFLGSVVWVPAS